MGPDVSPLLASGIFPWVGLVMGLVLGSFLSVVTRRLPAGASLLFPASHCPACGTALRWRDNLPLLGFALQMGRCRVCKVRIPWRYPLLEVLMAGWTVLVALTRGPGPEFVLLTAFGALLLALGTMELESGHQPPALALAGAAVAVVAAPWLPGGSPQLAVAGGLAAAGSLWGLSVLRRSSVPVRSQAVLLLFLCGSLAGLPGAVWVLALSWLLALAASLAPLRARGLARTWAPALCCVTLCWLLLGRG